MTQNIIHIEATNLPDLFFQTLYKAVEVGRDFKIDQGSFAGQVRKEFDFVVLRSRCPDKGELIPKLNPALNLDNPVADDYIGDYIAYLMTGNIAEGEAYTYGQRICDCVSNNDLINTANLEIDEFKDPILEKMVDRGIITFDDEDNFYVNQMELMIWTYKNKGHRNNQMILQVGQPSDMKLKDPPCLRHIDTRIQDGKLHFYPYFRSWDLWGGLPANLAAIELMKQHCADEIGVGNGEIIATSKGLHLYDYVFEIAEAVRGRTAEEFKEDVRLEQGSLTKFDERIKTFKKDR